MHKTFKILGIVFGGLVLLVVVVALILPLLVDPNDFKPRIQAAVEEATGRQLEIPGDIDLSVFPWLGVELGGVRLGNAPGFGKEPFAAVEGVQVRVKLLPLLSRNIEIGKVVVEQPVIRLEKNAAGETNWEDLAGTEPSESAAPEEEGGTLPEFSIDGLDIRQARVFYSDAAAGSAIELKDFNLEAGRLGLPADFPLAMSGAATLSDPGMSATFEFKGHVVADTGKQMYSLRDGELTFDVKGNGLPVSPVAGRLDWEQLIVDLANDKATVTGLTAALLGMTATVAADVTGLSDSPGARGQVTFSAADLAQTAKHLGKSLPANVQLSGKASGKLGFSYDQAKGIAHVPEFTVSAMGMNVTGNVDARNLNDAPAFKGAVNVAEFSPGQLMVKLGQELPKTQDAEVFDSAALMAKFDVAPNRAVINDLRVALDQSTLSGRIEIADIEKQAVRFTLALDQIDADRYLPPSEEPAATGDGGEPLDQMEIPAELIRSHDITGKLTIGKLKAFDFNSTDVNIGVAAQNDKLRIHPATAKFYGGGYRGDIRVDASADTPVVAVDEHVDRIQLAPLVKDVLDVENISGSAQIDVKASARGKTIGALRKTLNGSFGVDIKDGAIEGFNLWESIREAYAKLKGRPYDAGAVPERTEFAALSASGTIDKGVVQNDDLAARLPFLDVAGKGQIDIAKATLDYTVEATILKSPELTDGIEELTGTAIPVRLTGPLTSPKVRPDVKGILEAKAKEALEKKEQELRDEAKRKAEEERRRLEDKLKDKLKDFLG